MVASLVPATQPASTVCSVLVDALGRLGVVQAFGVMGGAIAPFFHAVAHSEIQTLHFRHEAGAAFAAVEASIAKALQLVRCEYLVWVAADDRLLPPFLERNMALLARHPAAALSFSEVVVLKGDSEEVDRFATNPDAPRIFDLSGLPAYLSPEQLRKRMKRAYLPIASNTAVKPCVSMKPNADDSATGSSLLGWVSGVNTTFCWISGLTSGLLRMPAMARSSGRGITLPTGFPPICSATSRPAAIADVTLAVGPTSFRQTP